MLLRVWHQALALAALSWAARACTDLPPLPLFPPIWETLKSVAETIQEIFHPETAQVSESVGALVSRCMREGRALSAAAGRRAAALVRLGHDLASWPRKLRLFFSGAPGPAAAAAIRQADEIIAGTTLLQAELTNKYSMRPLSLVSFLRAHEAEVSAQCTPLQARCEPARYRSLDGSCNNLQHPGWGRAYSAFERLAPPSYSDGVSAPRLSASGRPLASARAVSTALFPARAALSPRYNYLNMQWAQFITHDMATRIIKTTESGSGLQCCARGGRGQLPADELAAGCLPFSISEWDATYAPHGVTCHNFVRSACAPPDDCVIGPAQQMNGVTAYLDGSMIYGSDEEVSWSLRTGAGGELRASPGGFLPHGDPQLCGRDNGTCYLTGDDRANQLPPLSALHVVWLREHNRVARELARLHPRWSDTRLFHEARRIVIAELQHITYHEWIPLNLGEAYVRYFGVTSGRYRADMSGAVLTCFTTAAFRALHSTVPDTFAESSPDFTVLYHHRLSDHYLEPGMLERAPGALEAVVRGMVRGPAAVAGARASSELAGRFLATPGSPAWGLDLIAMDIQRGRDHGLPSYNDIREICGMRRVQTFAELSREMPLENIVLLESVYASVEDVEVLAGGALERALGGAQLGPTLQCLLAEQFYRTRVADRYFYDHMDMDHSFTPEQLRELQKTSMARVLCDNTDVELMPSAAFRPPGADNPLVPCGLLPAPDLDAWA